jgi:protocatechuate 3,4-dioxygenase alpha subunit
LNDAFSNKPVTADTSGTHSRRGSARGDGKPINDAMLEIWQADAQGRYANPRDNRALPNTQFRLGRWPRHLRVRTVKPGRCGPNGKAQAPHIVFCIFSGMLRQIYTTVFGDEAANDSDPILALVPADGGDLLPQRDAGELPVYRFDIRAGRKRDGFFDI